MVSIFCDYQHWTMVSIFCDNQLWTMVWILCNYQHWTTMVSIFCENQHWTTMVSQVCDNQLWTMVSVLCDNHFCLLVIHVWHQGFPLNGIKKPSIAACPQTVFLSDSTSKKEVPPWPQHWRDLTSILCLGLACVRTHWHQYNTNWFGLCQNTLTPV